MNDLPIEIIHEILIHTSADSNDFIMLAHDPSKFPWYLGHICSMWRAAFLSASWIWRRIVIVFGDTYGPGRYYWNPSRRTWSRNYALKRASLVIELCIKRSQDQGLYLSIDAPEAFKGLKTATQILTTLIAQSERWLSLELACSAFILEAFAHAGIGKRLSRLRSLRLRSQSRANVAIDLSSLFLDIPYLMQLDLKIISDWKLSTFNWSRLTMLCFDVMDNIVDARDLLLILRQMEGIERLALRVPADKFNRDITTDSLVSLPLLKILMCRSVVLLKYLDAPSLEELHIDNPEEHLIWNEDPSVTFLLRSSPNLKSLALRNWFSEPEQLLALVPNVVHLCVTGIPEVLGPLIPPRAPPEGGTGSPLLPRLQSLAIRHLYSLDVSIPMLRNIVAFRTICDPPSSERPTMDKLQKLSIVEDNWIDLTDLRKDCEKCRVEFSVLQKGTMGEYCKGGKTCIFELSGVSFMDPGLTNGL